MRFKTGDKVLVKKDISHCPGAVGSMYDYQGKVVDIADCGSGTNYYIKQDGGEWNWHESCFEGKVKPKIKPKVYKVKFDSVIMPDEKKAQIKAAISQMDNTKKIFEDWGFAEVFEKGTAVSLLFHGVPGTGKTLMAQAIADKMRQRLLIVGPAEIETSTPGGAERNIKRFFKVASGEIASPPEQEGSKAVKAKHVLLFDECDSLITNRDNVGIIMRGQINTLLSELEFFEGIVIFTTNSVKSLDPAMERRITAKVEFEFPNQEARRKIWDRMIPKKAPIDSDVSLDKLSEFQFSGGNIKNIVLNAARHASYLKLKSINYDCFLTAMEKEAAGMKAFEATYLASSGRPHRKPDVIMGDDSTLEIQDDRKPKRGWWQR